MNDVLRKKVVLAMELLASCVTDETAMDGWLMCGVADGDIPFGSLDVNDVPDYYIDDKSFSETMGCFMRTMNRAQKDGLFVDSILSEGRNRHE